MVNRKRNYSAVSSCSILSPTKKTYRFQPEQLFVLTNLNPLVRIPLEKHTIILVVFGFLTIGHVITLLNFLKCFFSQRNKPIFIFIKMITDRLMKYSSNEVDIRILLNDSPFLISSLEENLWR